LQDKPKIDREWSIEEIVRLKRDRGALILAHNYQPQEIQLIADLLGDSLFLAQRAAEAKEEVIILCGVHFMAESAAILAPNKTVLLPREDAGCPMADMVTVPALREKKKQHPKAMVACYVNSSAAVKAESDICCTSANAVSVVKSLDADEILFVPDRNLGLYVQRFTEKKIIPWNGYCPSHHFFTKEELLAAKEEHPNAVVIVHPECTPDVIDLADKVLSTSGMVRFAREAKTREMIVGTEEGLVERLRREFPQKNFYLPSDRLFCVNMKKMGLEDVVQSLRILKPRITVPDDVAAGARRALERMLAIPREN
jgi:quinolinate synthase